MKKNKLVCIVGMPGSGKSVLADWFVEKGFEFYRFGQVVLDEAIKSGKEPNEILQKTIREDLRKKHGMDAIAKILHPKFLKALKTKSVVADGLYSFSEYKFLKRKFKDQMIVIAVYAPPKLRYERISKRKPDKSDKKLRNHAFTKEEAKKRDFAEIENIEKGGPIAMADITLLNTKELKHLRKQFLEVFKNI